MTANLQDSGVSAGDWSGAAGRLWVEIQDISGRMLRPFENILIAAAEPLTSVRVLDVGCGTGFTTDALARRVGRNGVTHGIDISPDMIAAAQERAHSAGLPIRFIKADAQTFPFDPNSYDLIVSRFGIMFFDDPQAAFRNIAQAMDQSGRFVGLVWRWAEDNDFMTVAERAAAPLLPELAPRTRDAAGQFGFADPERVIPLFEGAGWRDVNFQAVDAVCTLPADDLSFAAARLGPVGRLLPGLPETLRRNVLDAIMPAFDRFIDGDTVRFDAACWLIEARLGHV